MLYVLIYKIYYNKMPESIFSDLPENNHSFPSRFWFFLCVHRKSRNIEKLPMYSYHSDLALATGKRVMIG